MKATGIILAGGKSSRMGKNKALLEVGGVTVIERISSEIQQIADEVIVVTNELENYRFLNLPMARDNWEGMAPLAGIEAGLSASGNKCNLIVACDMPFADAAIGEFLLNGLDHCDAAVPDIGGRRQPLFASYRKEVLTEVRKSLSKQELKLQSFLDRINVQYIKESELVSMPANPVFYNMNHPEEYEEALKIYQSSRYGR